MQGKKLYDRDVLYDRPVEIGVHVVEDGRDKAGCCWRMGYSAADGKERMLHAGLLYLPQENHRGESCAVVRGVNDISALGGVVESRRRK